MSSKAPLGPGKDADGEVAGKDGEDRGRQLFRQLVVHSWDKELDLRDPKSAGCQATPACATCPQSPGTYV